MTLSTSAPNAWFAAPGKRRANTRVGAFSKIAFSRLMTACIQARRHSAARELERHGYRQEALSLLGATFDR